MTTFKILNKTTFTMRLATLTTCRLDETEWNGFKVSVPTTLFSIKFRMSNVNSSFISCRIESFLI